MDGPDQTNYPHGNFDHHYYNGHLNSTITTNFSGLIASNPTFFPLAPWLVSYFLFLITPINSFESRLVNSKLS